MSPKHEEFMSVSAAARMIGRDHSTLSKQVRLGLIRSHGGKVRLSEVLADRAANLMPSKGHRGGMKAGPGLNPIASAHLLSSLRIRRRLMTRLMTSLSRDQAERRSLSTSRLSWVNDA